MSSTISDAPITVNFHPDRLVADGRTVAQCLLAEGRYRSQFETGISNGGLTAYPGGDRDVWEQRMFPGRYTGPLGRPVYGALNLAGYPDGASPRFGSCHLRLDPAVSARATFSHGDSVTEPAVGRFEAVWASLLAEVAATGSALGLQAGSADEWVARLAEPRTAVGRCMDHYVEAQIHGGLELAGSVTAVVADPSFRGTSTGVLLAALGPALEWHPGFVLSPDEFPADLRLPSSPALAAAIATRYDADLVDAALIGRAARDTWPSFGPDLPQQLKYLWHILVLRGRPFTDG